MALWARFKELADRLGGPGAPALSLREEELRLASAALLVHAAVAENPGS